MTTAVTERESLLRRLTLPQDPFRRTLLGLGLGIFCGLFFGELVGFLQTVGLIYVRLLQMTVLPYVLAAVIAGIGRLDPAGAGVLGMRALVLTGVLWLITWATSLTLPFAYPTWESGSFYSSTLGTEGGTSLMDLFIPSNIFNSLTNSVVPAVVVFGVAMGLALMAMPEKDVLLSGLGVVEKAMGRIMSFVVKFAPLGVFAMAGSAAGTIQLDEFERLQIYLWTYAGGCVVLGFFTLPLLVTMATPLSYWQVIKTARTAMITAFAVGTVLVVVPIIAEECKKLLKESGLGNPDTDSTVDVLAPTTFAFPTAGTAISLAFILFAAWFVGQPLELDQYPAFASLGLLSSFGGMLLALPFLLDFFRLPADLFNLFVLGGVVTNNLFTATAAMHGVVICLLAACAVVGSLRWTTLAATGAVCVVVAGIFFWLTGFAFKGILPHENIGEQRLLSMQLTEKPVSIAELSKTSPLGAADLERDRLSVIRDRRSLRIGILPDRLPFVFRNAEGQIVGLDMDLMHGLAGDLRVTLELAKVSWGDGRDWLNEGRVDIVVGGVVITPARALNASFTKPYLEQTPGFLIKDVNRRDFVNMDRIRAIPSLKVGTIPNFFHEEIQRLLPDAEFKVLSSPKGFLTGEAADIDAMLFPAQMGSAWTLIYPGFMVAVPDDLRVRVPVGLALPDDQQAFASLLNNWLEVNVSISKVDELHRYWVLGEANTAPEPRWSIIRDVLGWVD